MTEPSCSTPPYHRRLGRSAGSSISVRLLSRTPPQRRHHHYHHVGRQFQPAPAHVDHAIRPSGRRADRRRSSRKLITRHRLGLRTLLGRDTQRDVATRAQRGLPISAMRRFPPPWTIEKTHHGFWLPPRRNGLRAHLDPAT